MGTFAALQTALAAELRDPSALTFDSTDLANFINQGVIQVGRIAPERFQADLTPVANQLSYTIRNGEPECELKRVEVWDTSTTPDTVLALLPPMSREVQKSSDTGWEVWGGKLYLPPSVVSALVPASNLIRVWGYGPYAIVSGSTELPMSDELEYAVRTYAKIVAIESLVQMRNLFTQWQAQPGNTDVSPAMLIQQLTVARGEWHRLAADLFVMREAS